MQGAVLDSDVGLALQTRQEVVKDHWWDLHEFARKALFAEIVGIARSVQLGDKYVEGMERGPLNCIVGIQPQGLQKEKMSTRTLGFSIIILSAPRANPASTMAADTRITAGLLSAISTFTHFMPLS